MTATASTADTIVLVLSEAAYLGNAQFAITVNGVQVGGIQTVDAVQAYGQTQSFTVQGNFGTGPQVIGVKFLNPATGGTVATTRSLYLDSVSLDGTAIVADATVTATTTETITAASPPPATNTLTVNVAESAYLGNAQFIVLVDGVQVGGTFTATALEASGQSQNVTLTGDFGPGPHSVSVELVNYASGSTSGAARDLTVNSVTYDGVTTAVGAELASDTSTKPVTVADAATVTAGAVQPTDTLVLYMAEDAYEGNAQFTVSVDGVQVGGVMTATASHGAGAQQAFTLYGNWGAEPNAVTVTFLNDFSNSGGDRNLYVDAITYDGVAQAGDSATLFSDGSKTFSVQADTLVLYLAEDAYQGDAQFTVSINGQQVGGVMTVTAQRGLGQQEAFTFDGNYGTGPQSVVVTFLNDFSNSGGDRNLYVDSIVYNGITQAGQTAPLFSDGSKTFTVDTDTLVLNLAEDAYQGDAEFTVAVNGTQVGGIMTATAIRSLGQQQAFTFDGNWGAGPVKVTVTFLNDFSNSGGDRNLYVDSIAYDGTVQAGESAPLFSDGSANFTVQTATTSSSTTTTTGSDTLIIDVAEDAYQGDAEFTVAVNGTLIGGVMTATALRSQGQEQAFTLTGNWGAGPVNVTVTYLNDFSNSGGDRNLFVDSISYDGSVQSGASASLFSDGSANFTVQAASAPVTAPATDTLTIYVSEDAYLGNAEFSVTVDGKQVGGIQTATASNADGDSQGITLTGAFGSGAHTVVVTFLNDASGPTGDRNLYVSGIDYNGSYTGVNAALFSTGSASTTVVGATPAPSKLPLLSPAGTFKYVGVDLSGLEFGTGIYPGVLNTNYVEPTHAEIDYYASQGMNVIRLPFDWERLQPVMNGPLNQQYLSLIDDVVSYAGSKGITVDLDLNNFGLYYGNEVGSAAVPNSAFANVWSQLAGHFASTSNVMFGLMNEPHEQTASQWLTSANDAIAAIRAAGATTQEILVPGTDWTGGESWESSGNASVMSGIVDPDMNFAYEIHQYLDADSSGTSTSVVSPEIGVDRLTEVTQWAQTNGVKLFLAEFGATSAAASLTANQNMLAYMAQNTNVWQGAVEWGGGPWWGSYGFATDPVNGVTTPQITMLKQFIDTQAH
jgi:endoglucanase